MSSIQSPREVGESMTRVTAEGRKLTYELRVIQQPERARACGSGAKSSADRRPVDPPPVVELRIFAIEGDNKNDITFSYNANFFLYASLEQARPMAHGRVQPANSQVPVLTGMPVSGMAYLDRPTEAGYFIFPDLSVRHEGKYKLQFNLYEETKDPKDFDPEEPKQEGPPGSDQSFHWRLQVKSLAFTVYSAKKFPGLAESTALSRTVAEQGCRVRIRRDVRMRRRDGKNSGEFDEEFDEFSRQRTRTPETEAAYNRVRSMSNASVDRSDHYAADQSRRPSAVEYTPQPYQNNYAPSSAQSQPGSSTGYLAFGSSSAAPQYQAPPQYAPPPAPVQPIQPSQQYQASQANYEAGASQYRSNSISSSSHYSTERPSYQQYPSAAAAPREQYEQERRQSVGFARNPSISSHSTTHYSNNEPSYRNSSSLQQPFSASKGPAPITNMVNLAPLKMPPLEPRYDSVSSPSVPLSANRMGAPLPSPFESHSSRSNSYSAYSAALPTSSSEAPRSGKRAFDTVFSTASMNQPLHNGMRPNSSHFNGPSPAGSYDDDDDGPSMEELRMQYKRADGTSHARTLPNLQ